MKKIASGAYGNVFLRTNKKTIIKRSKNKNTNVSFECRLTRKIYKIAPQHVINIKGCTKRNLRMNYHRIGSLEGLFLSKSKILTDSFMMRVVKTVVATLAKIHKVDPSFRHNDLHIGNVLVNSSLNPIITDFGMASDKQYKNPLHKRWLKLTAGIYPTNHYMYDVHTFINFVYSYIKMLKLTKRLPMTYRYLARFLKNGYGGKENVYVKDYRLRLGVKFPFTYSNFFGSISRTRTPVVPSSSKSNDAWAKASRMLKSIATIKKI